MDPEHWEERFWAGPLNTCNPAGARGVCCGPGGGHVRAGPGQPERAARHCRRVF
jgi:hypothetical protein